MAQYLLNPVADGTRRFYTVYSTFTRVYDAQSIECSL
jgi:hypothetical protein